MTGALVTEGTDVAVTAMVFDGPGMPHRAVTPARGQLRPGELLIEVEFATVCGSDVHTVLGHRTEPTPLVLGHEAVGRVVEVGASVVGGSGSGDDDRPALPAASVGVGDRIVWSVAAHCGACDRCERGIPQKCRTLRKYGHARYSADWPLSGGFASHVQILAGTPVVVVGEELPGSVLAPAGCGIATAWAALAAAQRSESFSGAEMLVTGAGLIGLAATAMAVERGARVTVSDPDPDRRALAIRFGAADVIDPLQEGIGAADGSVAARAGVPAGGDGFDVVIEASGSPAAVALGLASTGIGGVMVWVGSVFPTDPVPIVPERVVRGLATIVGVHNYAPSDLDGAVRFLERCGMDLPFADFVGEVFPLDRIDAALERAAQHREIRVGIAPGQS